MHGEERRGQAGEGRVERGSITKSLPAAAATPSALFIHLVRLNIPFFSSSVSFARAP